MTPCPFEPEVSALLDAELDAGEARRVALHLARCPDCRALLTGFEAVDAAIRGHRSAAVVRPARLRPAARSAWTWAAAAALAAAIGVAVARMPAEPAPHHVEVALGSAPMTDARFVELTAEILRADRRMHRAMLEILSEVDRDRAEGEGTTDPIVEPPEGRHSGRGHV